MARGKAAIGRHQRLREPENSQVQILALYPQCLPVDCPSWKSLFRLHKSLARPERGKAGAVSRNTPEVEVYTVLVGISQSTKTVPK
jgi:hypothetical protein